MIAQIAECLHNPDITLSSAPLGADSLVSALFGPTSASREDPGGDDPYTMRDLLKHQEELDFYQ